MPKTDVVYGKSYKPCPCAQINDYTTMNNTYFTSTCYSPKRGKCKISDAEQVRICMGGTSRGKRYTSCPYYVRNANIKVPKRTRSNSSRNIIYHLIGAILCLMIASSMINSGVQYSKGTGLMFLVAGLACIVSLFNPSGKVDNGKRRKRK